MDSDVYYGAVRDAEEIANAAKAAAVAAKGVKSAVSAAAGAAKRMAGVNPAGVAALLKSGKGRKTAMVAFAVPALIFAFILLCVLYVYPMMMYETLQTWFQQASEAYMAEYLSGEGGNFFAGVGAWISSVFGSIKDALLKDNEKDIELDARLISDRETPGKSLKQKIEETKEKYSVRRDRILSQITGRLNGAYGYFCNRAQEKFREQYRTAKLVIRGHKFNQDELESPEFEFDTVMSTADMTDIEALRIAAMYNVVTDNDFGETEISDYLKWLGYKDSSEYTMEIPIADGSYYSYIFAWDGKFLPSFLNDEARFNANEAGEKAAAEVFEKNRNKGMDEEEMENKRGEAYAKAYQEKMDEYTEEYGMSAMDFYIQVYVPNSLTPYAKNLTRTILDETIPDDEFYDDEELQSYISRFSEPEEGSVSIEDTIMTVPNSFSEYVCLGSYNEMFDIEGAEEDYMSTYYYRDSMNNGFYGKPWGTQWGGTGLMSLSWTEYVPAKHVVIEMNYSKVKYSVPVYITVRRPTAAIGMAGLLEGDYSDEHRAFLAQHRINETHD